MTSIFHRWSTEKEAQAMLDTLKRRIMHNRLAIIEAEALEQAMYRKRDYLEMLLDEQPKPLPQPK